MSVAFTIVNRGDSTSLPQPYGSLQGEVIRPLRPGESTQLVLTADYTDELHFEYMLPGDPLDARAADRRTISLNLQQRPADRNNFPADWPVEDADVSNNLHDDTAFHVAIPVLRATLSNVAEIRANDPFVASFRIENVSVHGADAGSFDVVLCQMGLQFVPDKPDALVPDVDEIVTEIDLDAERITIRPPEGLLDF